MTRYREIVRIERQSWQRIASAEILETRSDSNAEKYAKIIKSTLNNVKQEKRFEKMVACKIKMLI